MLDLDETLVHCTLGDDMPLSIGSNVREFCFPVEFEQVTYHVFVRCRPHLRHFLIRMSQCFELVLFTASKKVTITSLLTIYSLLYTCLLRFLTSLFIYLTWNLEVWNFCFSLGNFKLIQLYLCINLCLLFRYLYMYTMSTL